MNALRCLRTPIVALLLLAWPQIVSTVRAESPRWFVEHIDPVGLAPMEGTLIFMASLGHVPGGQPEVDVATAVTKFDVTDPEEASVLGTLRYDNLCGWPSGNRTRL
ncbi:MAG: hypothetical protein ACI9MR_003008 [Myxococcota bacterium]|jgi:hypothetical protein